VRRYQARARPAETGDPASDSNDAVAISVAWQSSMGQKRDGAAEAVRPAVSLSASEGAHAQCHSDVIPLLLLFFFFLGRTCRILLRQKLDGRSVKKVAGKPQHLGNCGLEIVTAVGGLRTELLAVITDSKPIAFIVLMIRPPTE